MRSIICDSIFCFSVFCPEPVAGVEYLHGVPKIRLHLSYANQTQQGSPIFLHCMPMCSPHNAAHFDIRFGMPDTRRSSVADGIFAHADFSRSVSCWTLVHSSSLSSSCWRISHRFSSTIRSGELPCHTCFSHNAGRMSLHHSWDFLEACAGAPSCMKLDSDIFGAIFLFRIVPFLDKRQSAGSRVFVRIS